MSLRVPIFVAIHALVVTTLVDNEASPFDEGSSPGTLLVAVAPGATDAELDTLAAELARKHGMKRLKLYVMVGLPTETDEANPFADAPPSG